MLLDEVQSALDKLGFGSRVRIAEPDRLEFDGCLRLSREGEAWRISVIERNLVMDVIMDCAEEPAACAAFLDEITCRHYPVLSSDDLLLVEAAERVLAQAAIPSLRRWSGAPGQALLLVEGENFLGARQALKKGEGLPSA
jgi:hypothetical protein